MKPSESKKEISFEMMRAQRQSLRKELIADSMLGTRDFRREVQRTLERTGSETSGCPANLLFGTGMAVDDG
jgi:hypothetical protein